MDIKSLSQYGILCLTLSLETWGILVGSSFNPPTCNRDLYQIIVPNSVTDTIQGLIFFTLAFSLIAAILAKASKLFIKEQYKSQRFFDSHEYVTNTFIKGMLIFSSWFLISIVLITKFKYC